MSKKLQRDVLVQLAENVIHPKGKGFTSQQINRQLLDFCVNCPDPVAAMKTVINAPRGSTAEAIVAAALSFAPRDPRGLPETELAMSHPLRQMRLEE